MRVCLAGTFDPEFARNRMLVRTLRRTGAEVELCAVPLWGTRRYDVLERSRLRLVIRAVAAYATLLWRFGRLLARRPPDVVVVAYPGYFDMPLVSMLCRLRRIPVVFDLFISLHDTLVSDRGLVSSSSLWARLARVVDRLGVRMARVVLADTPVHADFFAESTGEPRDRFAVLWLGAQEDVFHPIPGDAPLPDLVAFHGTFIGLQGVDTIVRAAKLLEPDGIRVRLIGSGQEQATVDQLVEELRPANLELTGFVPLDRLPTELARASLCLGIFGTSDKAARVVPNKLYECLALGRPVLTRDSPAIRAAFDEGEVATCPSGNPAALADAIRSLVRDPASLERLAKAGHARYLRDYSESALAGLLEKIVADVASTTALDR